MAFGSLVTDNKVFAFGISASLSKFFETWKFSLKFFIVSSVHWAKLAPT
jgi:hypothetical protein